jgi:hypothetical protein
MATNTPRRARGSRIRRYGAPFVAAGFAGILIGALALGGAVVFAADPTDVGDAPGQRMARPEALKGQSIGDGTAENPQVVPVLGFWIRGLLAVALVAPGAVASIRVRRESDFLTNRGAGGRSGAQLRREFESMRRRLVSIIEDRKNMTHFELVERLEALAPWATPEALEEAANAGPVGAAHILLGSREHVGRNAFRKQLVRAKRQA